jgi:hypothetical protein
LTDVPALERTDRYSEFLTEDGRWQVASLAIADSVLELAAGVKPLKKKSQQSAAIGHFIRGVQSEADIQLLVADRGFDGANDIENIRLEAPSDWLIHARDLSEVTTSKDDYERLNEKIESGEQPYLSAAGPNNLSPPTKMLAYVADTEENDTEENDTEENDTDDLIRMFYSDIDIKNVEGTIREKIASLNFCYNQRNKIEKMFDMIKNSLDVATDSDRPNSKSVYLHMAVLFYNFYQIVETIPTPQAGLELSTTQKELLAVTCNLAFDGVEQPAAERHYLNNKQ